MKKLRIPLLIGLCILILVVIVIDPIKILESLKGANYGILLLAPIAIIVTYYIQTIRFCLIMSTKFRFGIFSIVSSAAVSNLISPGGTGDVFLRPYLIKRRYNIPYRKSFVCVLFERLLDLTALIMISAIAAFYLLPTKVFMLFTLIGLILGSVLAWLLISSKKITFLRKIQDSLNLIKKIPTRLKFISIILSIINMGTMIVTISIIALALNLNPSFIFIGLFFLSQLIGLLSFIPGGLGVSDATFIGLLYVNGLEPSIGASITILFRLSMLLIAIIFLPFAIRRSG